MKNLINSIIFLPMLLKGAASMKLIKSDKEVQCVQKDAKAYDDYCLQVDFNEPAPADMSFNCYFDEKLVYACNSSAHCEAEGFLKNIAFAREDKPCTGIPLADIYPNIMGLYECSTSVNIQKFQLSFCNNSVEPLTVKKISEFTSTTPLETLTVIQEISDFTSTIYWIVGILICLILALGGLFVYNRWKRRGMETVPQEISV